MEDSWSRWAVLSKKVGPPPINLAAYKMERNVQLLLERVAGETLFPRVSQGSFKASGQSESSAKNLRTNMNPLPMEGEVHRTGWDIWKEKTGEGS